MIKDQYVYLKMVDDEKALIEIINYLRQDGIEVIAHEKGYGSGPLRPLFMGKFDLAHIEIFVRDSQYEKALKLLDFQEFSEELDEDLKQGVEDENNKPN